MLIDDKICYFKLVNCKVEFEYKKIFKIYNLPELNYDE